MVFFQLPICQECIFPEVPDLARPAHVPEGTCWLGCFRIALDCSLAQGPGDLYVYELQWRHVNGLWTAVRSLILSQAKRHTR